MLNINEIKQRLTHKELVVETHECVDSTNTMLKQRGREGAPHGLIIAAEHQTAGRGRMGRDFFSPADTGIYFSILLRPSLNPEDCLLITTAAAVSCARVLEHYAQTDAKIKWVNDIYIDNKKVCGILTEAAFAGNGKIDYAVLGIGVNLSPPKNGFPVDITHKAGTVFKTVNADLRGVIMADILNDFLKVYETIEKREFIQEYRSRSLLDGMPVEVIKHNCIIPAEALYVDEKLQMVVRYQDGTMERLSSGDVSIKKA